MKFKIKYLREKEFEDLLESLEVKLEIKIIKELLMIEELGIDYVDTKPLQNGIFELRTSIGTNAFRTLFFYDKKLKEYIVITGGFVKKSRRTPRKVVINAIKLKEEYEKE